MDDLSKIIDEKEYYRESLRAKDEVKLKAIGEAIKRIKK